jgi:two-component system chemotaxis response regulator CheB
MPPTFTTILAENLGRASGRPCKEAEHGDILKMGAIYVAPGGKHMLLVKGAGNVVIRLDDGPPVNFCKPAVDPMFNSIAPIFGPATLAVVLTGMGHDGAAGAGAIHQAGGSIIAQDEATSVVWGMPGAAAEAGICSAVLPLDAIGHKLKQIIGRGAV